MFDVCGWEFKTEFGVFSIQRLRDGGYELEHRTDHAVHVSYHLDMFWVQCEITKIKQKERLCSR